MELTNTFNAAQDVSGEQSNATDAGQNHGGGGGQGQDGQTPSDPWSLTQEFNAAAQGPPPPPGGTSGEQEMGDPPSTTSPPTASRTQSPSQAEFDAAAHDRVAQEVQGHINEGGLTPEQAQAELETLERERAKPRFQHQLRPEGTVVQIVHTELEAKREARIAELTEMLNSQENDLEDDPEPSL